VVVNAEKTAVAYDPVGSLPGSLVDHHPLDAAYPLVVRAIDRGAPDLVAPDQEGRFPLFSHYFRLYREHKP
jgi:hypothetical protein